MTCIELYPARLLSLTRPGDPVTLLRHPIRDVPLTLYQDLAAGDVLFIDLSHVAKARSDVCWLIPHVLPRLAPGVAVHFLDIFWPFGYPPQWLEKRRDWTGAYLLHAFLSGNAGWRSCGSPVGCGTSILTRSICGVRNRDRSGCGRPASTAPT